MFHPLVFILELGNIPVLYFGLSCHLVFFVLVQVKTP